VSFSPDTPTSPEFTSDVVLHSADGEHADPTLIGINTKNWYRQFKPASWSYPAYHCVDGIGKTFIIVR